MPDLHQTVLCGWDFALSSPPTPAGFNLKLVPVTRKSIHDTGLRAIYQFLWRGAPILRSLDPSLYDIVHFHFSVPTGMLAPLARGKPFVCSLHGIDVPQFVDEERALFQTLVLPINRWILSRAARVFAPSRHIGMRCCGPARARLSK